MFGLLELLSGKLLLLVRNNYPVFTTKVLQFIVTGGFPYPTIENESLLRKLKCGYRMECPENCSKEM